ncbi:MAG: hypothetical protein M0P33_01735 [Massilibacteroides sp.]|nr:hypothetical protein [Massilibacteroides sp.]
MRVLPAFPRGDNAETSLRINPGHAKPGAPEKILNFTRGIKAGMGEEPVFSPLVQVFPGNLPFAFDKTEDE